MGKVMVVDDNPALAENLVEILDAHGHQALAASSIRAATETARDGVDVALVDLKLPDGDGHQLIGPLKERSPDAEVILLTGFASVESAAAAVRAGAWAYLLKPCATDELLRTVDLALRQVKLKGEKRELARRAQVAEKLATVGTLTAGLSHEIRNPLNSAALQLSVLESRVGKLSSELQGPLLEPLRLVRDEIRRLDHTLQDFLQFARPVQFEPRPLELGPLLETISSFLSLEAAQRGVTLTCECEPGLPKVAGAEDPLRQVFMNLALNALDAASEGGRVRVGCRVEPEAVVVEVEDSGPGISPEAAEHIFEPFYTTKAGGSGLGLPIAHAIISQHGGSMRVDRSTTLGGARFCVSLPRV